MPNYKPITRLNNQPLSLHHIAVFKLIILIRNYLSKITNILNDGAAMVYNQFSLTYLLFLQDSLCGGTFHFILMNLTEYKKANPSYFFEFGLESLDPQDGLLKIMPILFDQYPIIYEMLNKQDTFESFFRDITPSLNFRTLVKVMQKSMISLPCNLLRPILDHLDDYIVLNNLMILYAMSGDIDKVQYCINRGANDYKLAQKAALIGQNWTLVVLFEIKMENKHMDPPSTTTNLQLKYECSKRLDWGLEEDYQEYLRFLLELYWNLDGCQKAERNICWDILEPVYEWDAHNLFNVIARLSFFEIKQTMECVSFIMDDPLPKTNIFHIPEYSDLNVFMTDENLSETDNFYIPQ